MEMKFVFEVIKFVKFYRELNQKQNILGIWGFWIFGNLELQI